MKEIIFSKDCDDFIFDFYFSHNAQILMSIIGGVFIAVFTIFYLVKPYFTINDENYFLLVTFVAATAAFHTYTRYKWLSMRKRLRISQNEVSLYFANFPLKTISIGDIKEITTDRESALFFPLNTIVIRANDGDIKIAGFKKGEDLDLTSRKIREIISQRNPV